MPSSTKDFKSAGESNHAVYKLCAKHKFYKKEPTGAEKFKKTLSTIVGGKDRPLGTPGHRPSPPDEALPFRNGGVEPTFLSVYGVHNFA